MKKILSAVIILLITASFVFTNELDKGEEFGKIEKLAKTGDENRLTDDLTNQKKEDKAENSGPSFLPGFCFVGTVLGHTFWTTGIGLTFFDQIVKLQAYTGIAPAGGRISGLNIGIKLLVNIFSIPFDFFFGPDWEFFSIVTAVGTGLSYFSNTGEVIELSSDNSKFLGIFLAQIEVKLRFKQLTVFNTYSLFSELAIALIPSDVQGAPALVPKIRFGLRIGIF